MMMLWNFHLRTMLPCANKILLTVEGTQFDMIILFSLFLFYTFLNSRSLMFINFSAIQSTESMWILLLNVD